MDVFSEDGLLPGCGWLDESAAADDIRSTGRLEIAEPVLFDRRFERAVTRGTRTGVVNGNTETQSDTTRRGVT